MRDNSNGYEAIADEFARARTRSIGPATVRKWAKLLKPGASILDIGCGNGVPIAEALLQEGFAVYGVDGSETLVRMARERFPEVTIECSSVEDSSFFSRTFDAVVAWGLIFILPAETQRGLIGKVGGVLNRPGHFLFTAPRQACSWVDCMTGLPSVSLGHETYTRELARHGLQLVGDDEDEGGNYYYFAARL